MATAAHLPPQLTPISVLLDAFNHRNKNQHRRSHWWRQFNLLRRAVRRLIVAPRAQGSATLPHHVKWVAENVIPSSYIAFTQLAADNQYAPLGLVLLGVLARVSSIISSFRTTPFIQQNLPPKSSVRPTTTTNNRISDAPPSSQLLSHPSAAQDLGVAISRSELTSDLPLPEETARKVAPQRRGRDEPLAQAPRKPPKEFVPGPAQGEIKKLKKKKKKAGSGTSLDDLFSSIA